ncbi:MAG: VOC family protein [Candidatus Dojkabacteria bacterium]|nr:VOC family protein [Candidatus Dojkabacteria bacterium]
MLKNIDCVLIWTDNLDEMREFYTKTLGMKEMLEMDHPKDTGILYEFENGAQFWIGLHSEVKGKNQDPARHMINFLVDSVQKTYEELKAKGVKFIADPFEAPTGGSFFATFEDPDGNLLQLWSKDK